MKKIVACIQSSYIPWKGYFDQIGLADEFIFYDDVQYTKKDWRNRNKIKTPSGSKWLTIPCGHDINRLICDVRIVDNRWQKNHWSIICQCYKRSEYYKYYKEFFAELYLNIKWVFLSELNQTFIRKISSEILGFKTNFRDSREFNLSPNLNKEDRWIDLLTKTVASDLIIGPSARNYLDERKIDKVLNNGIKIHWMNYDAYPEYNQHFPPFDHYVSIIDLIFNEGQNAVNFMKTNSLKGI